MDDINLLVDFSIQSNVDLGVSTLKRTEVPTITPPAANFVELEQQQLQLQLILVGENDK
jgi:hypothetical protein